MEIETDEIRQFSRNLLDEITRQLKNNGRSLDSIKCAKVWSDYENGFNMILKEKSMKSEQHDFFNTLNFDTTELAEISVIIIFDDNTAICKYYGIDNWMLEYGMKTPEECIWKSTEKQHTKLSLWRRLFHKHHSPKTVVIKDWCYNKFAKKEQYLIVEYCTVCGEILRIVKSKNENHESEYNEIRKFENKTGIDEDDISILNNLIITNAKVTLD